MEVPFLDLKAQNRALKAEMLPLWEDIVESAGFIGGKHLTAFEEEFASACSAEYCVAVNSGTDALRFILLALGLRHHVIALKFYKFKNLIRFLPIPFTFLHLYANCPRSL